MYSELQGEMNEKNSFFWSSQVELSEEESNSGSIPNRDIKELRNFISLYFH